MKKEVTKCLLCNTPLQEPATWRWLLSFEFPRTICSGCEEQFEPAQQGDEECISLYKYNDVMKDFLHRYKFMHDVVLAKVFRQQIHKMLAKRTEIIVPIPIHPYKLKERTFAHVDELLKAAEIPFTHYLEKTTLETQAEKSREERIHTPQIFKLKENVQVKDLNILLFDDILTTGTTIQHAKNELVQAGAKSVKAVTLLKG